MYFPSIQYGKMLQLIDTLLTMLRKGKISMTYYRMWFKLNNRTRISILTPVGETTLINGDVGQMLESKKLRAYFSFQLWSS